MNTEESRSALHESIRDYAGGDHAVDEIRDCVCACGSTLFVIGYDDDEGVAVRLCAACDREVALLDSADVLEGSGEDMSLDAAECTCDATEFSAAVGFAMRGADVVWVSLGLRCADCGLAGVYTDWGIDYSPSAHLLERV